MNKKELIEEMKDEFEIKLEILFNENEILKTEKDIVVIVEDEFLGLYNDIQSEINSATDTEEEWKDTLPLSAIEQEGYKRGLMYVADIITNNCRYNTYLKLKEK